MFDPQQNTWTLVLMDGSSVTPFVSFNSAVLMPGNGASITGLVFGGQANSGNPTDMLLQFVLPTATGPVK